jgi:7-cyano-7-deazaguanine synthase
MCSIWGSVVYSVEDPKLLAQQLTKMAVSSEDRGRDGTGVIVVYPKGETYSFRSEKTASECSEELESFLRQTLIRPSIVIGNDRYQPLSQPDSVDPKARQPILAAKVALTHNGTFPEDDLIFEKYGFTNESGIDSEVLCHLFRKKLNDIVSPSTPEVEVPEDVKISVDEMYREVALQEALSEVAGGFACGLVDLTLPTHLFLFRNFKPLTIAFQTSVAGKTLWFNSEKKNILAGLGLSISTLGLFDQSLKFHEIPPYTGSTFSVDALGTREWEATNKILAHIPTTAATKKRSLIIASGGMDSSLAAAIARKVDGNEVVLLHLNYNQMAWERECEAVHSVAEVLGCSVEEVDVSMVGRWNSTSPLVKGGEPLPVGMRSAESTICWTAARNLVFLTLAASYAESKGYAHIYSGAGLEEAGSYNDNTLEFIRNVNQALRFGTQTGVSVKLAIARFMKPDIVRLATHLSPEMMKYTWSCDSAGVDGPAMFGNKNDPRKYIPCGRCGCCFTRRLAHKKSGVVDQQGYAQELEGPVPDWYVTGNFKSSKASIEDLIAEVRKKN